MIQSAFVDMESMFDLLTEEKEVSGHWTFCSQAKGKSKSVYTEQVLVISGCASVGLVDQ